MIVIAAQIFPKIAPELTVTGLFPAAKVIVAIYVLSPHSAVNINKNASRKTRKIFLELTFLYFGIFSAVFTSEFAYFTISDTKARIGDCIKGHNNL